jgi:hypothetical protein
MRAVVSTVNTKISFAQLSDLETFCLVVFTTIQHLRKAIELLTRIVTNGCANYR